MRRDFRQSSIFVAMLSLRHGLELMILVLMGCKVFESQQENVWILALLFEAVLLFFFFDYVAFPGVRTTSMVINLMIL